jgi:Tfp pilus assembly PilM family ATPase
MISSRFNLPSLSMSKTKGMVGLDIEASSVAATELQVNGSVRVGGYGIAPLDAGVFREGEVHEPESLSAVLKDLFAANKLPKDVRLGVANQRVVVRTLRLPAIEDQDELETAIRFQAQDQIPMPLDQAVMDWQVIPPTPGLETQNLEVVVVAARRDMLQKSIAAVKGAGLRLAGIDHSAFALIRALSGENPAMHGPAFTDPGPQFDPMVAPPEITPTGEMSIQPAPVVDPATAVTDPAMAPGPAIAADPAMAPPMIGRLYCNLGDVTNLAVARGPYCMFTRVFNFGIEGIAQTLAERGGLTLDHARQWLIHVGLTDEISMIEGDAETVRGAREALTIGAAKLGDELRRSLEYYAALEGAVVVESIVVAGIGTTIPGLVEHLRSQLPVPVDAATPGVLAEAAGRSAARLTLSYGLGLEE